MKKLQNFINGKVVDSASGETTTLINPSTGQAFATAPNSNAADIARAMVEGMLCGLVDAVDALEKLGVNVKRIILIGGAAKNPAVSQIAAALFGREVLVPPAGEYVANGAARQAAWALPRDLFADPDGLGLHREPCRASEGA